MSINEIDLADRFAPRKSSLRRYVHSDRSEYKVKITVKPLFNRIVINQTHLTHHYSLFHDFLVSNVRSRKSLSSPNEIEQEIIQELEDTYSDWVVGEILTVGFVGMFHLWERQLRELLEEQFSLRKLDPPRQRRESIVSFFSRVLFDDFDVKVEDSIREPIEKARKLTNTYKHGTADKFAALFQQYPEFFPRVNSGSSDKDLIGGIEITKEEFTVLYNGIDAFWESLPFETDYKADYEST